MIANIKNEIDIVNDIPSLRELRDYADARLQQLKQDTYQAKIDEYNEKYKDKYLLIYGKTYDTVYSVNPNEIKIVHVLDVTFGREESFRCLAKTIEINYASEETIVNHLSAKSYSECHVSMFVEDQYDVTISNIQKIRLQLVVLVFYVNQRR